MPTSRPKIKFRRRSKEVRKEFDADEDTECPKCHVQMKAPVKTEALRCAVDKCRAVYGPNGLLNDDGTEIRKKSNRKRPAEEAASPVEPVEGAAAGGAAATAPKPAAKKQKKAAKPAAKKQKKAAAPVAPTPDTGAYRGGDEVKVSFHRGVSWDKSKLRWKAQISIGGKQKYFGLFDTEEAAVKVCKEARDKAGEASVRQASKHSKYRGVSWQAAADKWRAAIFVKGKQLHLGLYTDDKDAGAAYDYVAREHGRPESHCNFPASEAKKPAPHKKAGRPKKAPTDAA
jgi:hypothetical protein